MNPYKPLVDHLRSATPEQYHDVYLRLYNPIARLLRGEYKAKEHLKTSFTYQLRKLHPDADFQMPEIEIDVEAHYPTTRVCCDHKKACLS